MANVFEGKVVGGEEKIGIVCARFNEFIVSKLLGGAIDGLVRHGVKEENVDVRCSVASNSTEARS